MGHNSFWLDFNWSISEAPTLIVKPEVDRVIFNNPATIIYWKDGSKTVVKCQPGDTYDEEKGFMAAYLKKLLGNDNTFNKEIKKYCIQQYLPKED